MNEIAVEGSAGDGLTTGFASAYIGAFLLGSALAFWPRPRRYGQPIEKAGSR